LTLDAVEGVLADKPWRSGRGTAQAMYGIVRIAPVVWPTLGFYLGRITPRMILKSRQTRNPMTSSLTTRL